MLEWKSEAFRVSEVILTNPIMGVISTTYDQISDGVKISLKNKDWVVTYGGPHKGLNYHLWDVSGPNFGGQIFWNLSDQSGSNLI